MQVSDWAEAATAVGTLVLAVATFSSVRSGNRQGRNAERALNARLRPVLFSSRPHETTQKIRWGDDHWAMLETGHAVLEEIDRVIYLAIMIHLLYSYQEGGQRTISRFSVSRLNTETDAWFPSVVRHWYLEQDTHRR